MHTERKIGYHWLCRNKAANGTPSLGAVAAAEFQRSPSLTKMRVLSFMFLFAAIQLGCQADKEVAPTPPKPHNQQPASLPASSQTIARSSNTQPADHDPVLVHRVEPKYLADPRHHPEGTIIIQASVAESGDVSSVKVVQSLYPPLDQLVVEAVQQWKYKPASRNGKAVAAMVTIPITFRLDRVAE